MLQEEQPSCHSATDISQQKLSNYGRKQVRAADGRLLILTLAPCSARSLFEVYGRGYHWPFNPGLALTLTCVGDPDHVWIVGSYYHYSVPGGWSEPVGIDISPNPGKSDPMCVRAAEPAASKAPFAQWQTHSCTACLTRHMSPRMMCMRCRYIVTATKKA